ncbi:MAG: hypothetical protein C0617_11840 [Desulfuromonas sp.]|uniref:type II secretion system protein n=1 Tax=Desulfuromonas sp. TaxID=892 RepID=UPI000CA8E2EE|nr:prepilin-type N-terminal cleavage/methylation domain-containing protein [Desulfuromonas sp.]PLX83221.1 MAG: hypothetical protein C0617_11840 [Desulfuromonas sp.]
MAKRRESGFTLVELLVAVVMGALLMAALAGLVGGALGGREAARERVELGRQAGFALERMTAALRGTRRLLLPLPTVPVRDVLAVALDEGADLDGDGVADADNDGDGLFDEDPSYDLTNDLAPGIVGIDDDGDGEIDEGTNTGDDDEDGVFSEDPDNGTDDDGDGLVGEDSWGDLNGDAEAGVAGVDDDGDGTIDEGTGNWTGNDDEDEELDEDWLDPVVFFLSGAVLVERMPVPWDENGDGLVDGRDYLENPLAENVSLFQVERIANGSGRAVLVDLALTLTSPGGESVDLQTRVRVGGGL